MHEIDEYVMIQITITRVITGYLRQFIKLKPPYNLPGLQILWLFAGFKLPCTHSI